jgi:hypothetical protein
MQQIPDAIRVGIVTQHQREPVGLDFDLGTIPNLHSLGSSITDALQADLLTEKR